MLVNSTNSDRPADPSRPSSAELPASATAVPSSDSDGTFTPEPACEAIASASDTSIMRSSSVSLGVAVYARDPLSQTSWTDSGRLSEPESVIVDSCGT